MAWSLAKQDLLEGMAKKPTASPSTSKLPILKPVGEDFWVICINGATGAKVKAPTLIVADPVLT